MEESKIRKYVRDRYADIARQGSSCCGQETSCGCAVPPEDAGKRIGYSEEEIKAVPQGSNLGLGCGNPIALASLREGETVLDLGSGAGFDCFLAARKVGPSGRVIGVDMTPEMVEKARENARKGNDEGNVEFRLGEIENLPAADGSVDAVISNCVINLSTNKERVFAEAYRVLKPGGRVMISDLVLPRELPAALAGSLAAYAGCIAGAVRKEEYIRLLEKAGFREVQVVQERRFEVPSEDVRDAAAAILSVLVFGTKPI